MVAINSAVSSYSPPVVTPSVSTDAITTALAQNTADTSSAAEQDNSSSTSDTLTPVASTTDTSTPPPAVYNALGSASSSNIRGSNLNTSA